MTTFRFPLVLFLIASGCAIILPSCKEKNDEFPPLTWNENNYQSSDIPPRTISAILYENDHSFWLGSKSNEGLLHHDGYKWNIYDIANTGIEFDSVTAITRDLNGKLWIGWKSGLAVFDGTLWQKINQFDGLNVTSVAVEGIGNIVAGIKGKSGGIAKFSTNEWRFYTLLNSEIPSGNINSVASDHDQVLWMATADKGIIRFKNDAWENASSNIPLVSNNFTCIEVAADGSVWAGSAASQLIHFENDTFTVLNTGTSKPVTAIAFTDDNKVWCSTQGAGIINFDGQNWASHTMENASLPSNDILTLAIGTPGYLYFSIPGGKLLMIKQ